jgi:predicted flavoprotein YhiN
MLFPTKIVNQLLLNANLSQDVLMSQINNKNLMDFLENLFFEENIIGTRGFEFAQISTGAISSEYVDSLTLQSKIIKNLYFAGEILDVIGPCGGYNLHWAFISGIHAGRSIQLK